MTSSASNSPVDWDEFARQLDGDAELIEMLREMFLEYVDGQLERLEGAVDRGDPEAIARAAHAIKGTVAQVFAGEARRLAENIESGARAETSMEGIRDSVTALGREVEAVKAALSAKGSD